MKRFCAITSWIAVAVLTTGLLTSSSYKEEKEKI